MSANKNISQMLNGGNFNMSGRVNSSQRSSSNQDGSAKKVEQKMNYYSNQNSLASKTNNI